VSFIPRIAHGLANEVVAEKRLVLTRRESTGPDAR
jgi:hypothetical protein